MGRGASSRRCVAGRDRHLSYLQNLYDIWYHPGLSSYAVI